MCEYLSTTITNISNKNIDYYNVSKKLLIKTAILMIVNSYYSSIIMLIFSYTHLIIMLISNVIIYNWLIMTFSISVVKTESNFHIIKIKIIIRNVIIIYE